MTPDELREVLDEERGDDLLATEFDGEGVQIRAERLTLADRLDEDDDGRRLFGGLL